MNTPEKDTSDQANEPSLTGVSEVEATENSAESISEELQTAVETQPSFEELGVAPVLISALSAQSIINPAEVQSASIPMALAGGDLMVGADTGSGKTLAFLLPTLQRLSASEEPVKALVLAPTRELAAQIQQVAEPLAIALGLSSKLVIGGEDFKVQQRKLGQESGIWVATPGRLAEQHEANPQLLANVQVLILDEADRMLDMGFAETVLALASACPENRQSLLFSATLSGSAMRRVKEAVLREPQRIVLNDPRKAQAAIRHQVITADDDAHKLKLVAWLAQNSDAGCILAFCNSRERAQVFGDKLQAMGVRATSLHGELDTKQRNRAVRLLRESTVQVMVATDVAARGLDVASVALVINIDMPRRAHQYIHRVGRTGRAGATGQAVCLVNHNEWNLFITVERFLGQRFQRRLIDGLIGVYRGPKNQKASGKSVGKKKKKLKKR